MTWVIAIAFVLLGASAANAEPNKDAYELQVRCGKQSADAFAKDYVPVENTKDGQRTANYENHFSLRLNKCFFLEISVFIENGKWSRLLRLFDLNENKEYGSYWHSDKAPQFVNCNVQDARCSSEAEFRTLIKPYMED